MRRDVVHHPGACAVVALTDAGEVLLVRQRREAVRDRLIELPAGLYDRPGEPAGETARREVLEETGHLITGVEPMGSVYTSPGFSDERIDLFLAAVADPEAPDRPSEDGIEVVRMPFVEALERANRGEIADAKTAVALQRAAARRTGG